MAVHPNGETLYLTSEQKKLLLSIDLMRREVVSQVSTGMSGSHMVVLSPDGDRAYITNRESGTVSLLKTASPESIQHADAGDGAEGMALSHDGRWLLVANRNDNDLYMFDASDLSLEARITVGSGPVRVAIAPDDRARFRHPSRFGPGPRHRPRRPQGDGQDSRRRGPGRHGGSARKVSGST